jgi:transposase
MVLGYSRTLYVEYTEDEKVQTLIGCHERAMEYFGGITRTCLYDNMKTVVIGQDEQGEVIWNERFAKFATHHGFILRRCKPYRPRTKGKVENGVGYVRKNFWPRVQSFTGLHDLNQQVRF